MIAFATIQLIIPGLTTLLKVMDVSNIYEQNIESHQIVDKKAAQLYLHAPAANAAVLLTVLLYFLFLKNYSPLFPLFICSLLLSGISCYRLFLYFQRNKTPARYSARQWMFSYIIATGLAGCVWSSIFFLPYTHHDAVLYTALAIIFFGVSTSAVFVFAISLTAYYCYTLPILISFILKITQFEEFHSLFFIICAAVLGYYLMLSLFVKKNNQQMLQSIVLTLQNQQLIQQLQQESEDRGRLIKERTKQLVESNKVMAETKQRLQNVIEGARLGYWNWDYQTGTLEVNDRWLEILGLSRNDINNDINDWDDRIHPDDQQRINLVLYDAFNSKNSFVTEFRMRHKDGTWIWIQCSGAVIVSDRNDDSVRLYGIYQDITYRKRMEQELEFRAKHDCLTGLFNRMELEKECQEEINRAQRYQHGFSLFMIDVDHFKKINDTYGHLSGDQVLKQFAFFLQEMIRATDYVARYGGEEFVVILPETSLIEAKELAERLRIQTAKLNIALKQTGLKITISIGLSSYPEHGESYDQLLEAADSAMYQAKQRGRNCVHSASAS